MLLPVQKLKEKILKDRYNSIIFKKSRGKDLYLVGGYVRDILIDVFSQDRDYVLTGDARAFAYEIRNITGGSIVDFKKGGVTIIVLKNGVTLDFSRCTGKIEEDLSKRDFTINAIAWTPGEGIIDPYKGLEDLKKRKIRSLSEENFVNDPLRMLRAYRFAAELNGSIEKKTRKMIKRLHNMIKKVSSERITLELFNILNSERPEKYLKMAYLDGLLSDILSFNDKTLGHNIKEISGINNKFKKIPLKIKVELNKTFSQNITYKGLLRLELLMMGSHIRYEEILLLKISKDIIRRVTLAQKGIKKFNKAKLFDIFYETKEGAIDVLILKNRIDLIKEIMKFRKIIKKGILSSKEITEVAGISPGPDLGKAIINLKRAQFERKIKGKNEAKKFIKNIL